MLKKLLLTLLFIVLAIAGSLFAGNVWLSNYANKPIDIDKEIIFTLPAGTGRLALEQSLAEQEIIKDTTPFPYLLKFRPELAKFKAGTYRFQPGMTIEQMLLLLRSGKEVQFSIKFIEGTRIQDWLDVLNKAPQVKQTLTGLSEQQIAERLGIENPAHPEGWLYPDTYLYTAGTTDLAILKRAHHRMQTALEEEWQGREADLPYNSPYEMLIMASIIEKETGLSSERKLVASVFVNRLRLKMRLQTDPTVIYGMGKDYKGTITRKALNTATPYNTYIIEGLPPTPIAMPGIASIKAAAHPDKTNYLFFVATGNGGHKFSKDLRGHNQAVSEYRRAMASQRAS